MIEKEIKKGSAPLMFERLEYTPDSIHCIDSEEKLKDVLSYLFRISEYRRLANEMTRNNVYSENNILRGDGFRRRNNEVERKSNYINIMAYAKRCRPEYANKTYVETVPCYFSFPQDEIEKYRFEYNGTETYAFPLSGRHIINGLYLMVIMNRKAMAFTETPEYLETEENKRIYRLEGIRRVLFQCLTLDDMHQNNGLFEAKLNTIYLL
jgi:hypothetical protein